MFADRGGVLRRTTATAYTVSWLRTLDMLVPDLTVNLERCIKISLVSSGVSGKEAPCVRCERPTGLPGLYLPV